MRRGVLVGLGAVALGGLAWFVTGDDPGDGTALLTEYAVSLTEAGLGEVTIETDGRTWLVRPFSRAPVARRVDSREDEARSFADGDDRFWVTANGDVLLRTAGGTEALARPKKARALRLTRGFALWIEELPAREGGTYALIGRLDRRTGKTTRAKIPGATMEGASADAEGNVIFLKYLPSRGHREAFLRSAGGAVEALPYVGGTPLLLSSGEVVAPVVIGRTLDPFVVRTRLARLAGRPGARRWETLPVRFEP